MITGWGRAGPGEFDDPVYAKANGPIGAKYRLRVERLVVAALAFVAVGPLPYGYYQILRLVVCVFALFVAWEEIESGNRFLGWCFVLVAVLFNPVIQIHLKRSTWFWIDIGVGWLFGYSAVWRLHTEMAITRRARELLLGWLFELLEGAQAFTYAKDRGPDAEAPELARQLVQDLANWECRWH